MEQMEMFDAANLQDQFNVISLFAAVLMERLGVTSVTITDDEMDAAADRLGGLKLSWPEDTWQLELCNPNAPLVVQ